MKQNLPFYVVVVAALSIVVVLLVSGEHIKRENEQTITKYPGDDEMSRQIRNEAHDLVRVNKRQQLGLSITGGVILVISIVWRLNVRRRG